MKSVEENVVLDSLNWHKKDFFHKMLEEDSYRAKYIRLEDLKEDCLWLANEIVDAPKWKDYAKKLTAFIRLSREFTAEQNEYMLLEGVRLGIALGRLEKSAGAKQN